MSPGKSKHATDRMGVYKRLDDVSDRHRLHHHADAYEGRDVWHEYLTDHLYPDGDIPQKKRRFGDRWKDHTSEQGRHHALATPEDVETYSVSLLDQYAIYTAAKYWTNIERFYGWLQEHTEHPHLYHPFLMAADEYDAAGRIWDQKVRRTQS